MVNNSKPIIKTIIEADSQYNNYSLSVAYLITHKPLVWSARFSTVPHYPTDEDIKQVIAKGFSMEITGAQDKFGNIQGQYKKQFN